MPREHLYQPFEIVFKKLESFPNIMFKNNFFKLIYVVEGIGLLLTNESHIVYQKENLFLITPADSYSLTIEVASTFFFLNFSDTYIKLNTNQNTPWMKRLVYILQDASHQSGCIFKNNADKPLVASLIEFIHKNPNDGNIYHHDIIQQIVTSLIIITARNIALKLPEKIKENTEEAILNILRYIEENILSQEKLSIDILSKRFRISPSYLGRYFKKQTGETLQRYISNYKLRLIEARLLNSDMRMNEIARELNFTDESHLNRTFKRYKGLSPSEFRKKST